jgi:hypothetical protein
MTLGVKKGKRKRKRERRMSRTGEGVRDREPLFFRWKFRRKFQLGAEPEAKEKRMKCNGVSGKVNE